MRVVDYQSMDRTSPPAPLHCQPMRPSISLPMPLLRCSMGTWGCRREALAGSSQMSITMDGLRGFLGCFKGIGRL